MHEIITKEEDKGEKILNPAFDNLDEEKKKRIIMPAWRSLQKTAMIKLQPILL